MLPICLSLLALIVPDLRDHVALDVLVQLLHFLDSHFNGRLDAALEGHRAGAGGNRPHAFAEDRLSQNGCGGGAVTGHVGSLRGDFANHLCAHIFERIRQFDFLGHRHTVLGDDRSAKLLLDHRIAPLGAQGDLHSVGKNIDAAQDGLAGILTSHDLLCHGSLSSSEIGRKSCVD